jgi:cation transport regulator
MPYYASLTELPIGVRGNLPVQAQEVYRKAFNSAWMQYNQPAERIDDATREETSHRVAWAAVKRDFEKDERTGFWRPISLIARPEKFSSVPPRTASSAVAAKSPASRTVARKSPAKSAKKPAARAAKPAAKKPVKRVASSKTSASRTGAKKKVAKPVKRTAAKASAAKKTAKKPVKATKTTKRTTTRARPAAGKGRK